VFARDRGVVSVADVDAVLQRQSHRGPDGLKLWCDGPIGLGHAALDPAGSGRVVEPLIVDGGRLAITGDLRIDNRRDLAADLGPQPESASDAGIVLEAYRRWGIDVAEHLVGAFAFVIWDARDRRVVCVRDHLGQKPLTYHLSEKLLVCASEAEAVPCHPEVQRRISEARIADFLVSELEGVDHTSTFLEGVVRLPPAHVLVVEADRHRLHRYWEPDVETELRLGSDEAYAEAFVEVFRQAVGSCLQDISSPGLTLSGGIDSGAVAAAAGSLAEAGEAEPIRTFSAIDEAGDPSIESSCIRSMIDRLGVESFAITPDDIGGISPADRLAFLECGEPFDGSMVVPRMLYSTAAEAGCRAVLDGVDGDVVASISVPMADLVRQGRALRAWREAAAFRRRHPGAPSPWRELAAGLAKAWLPNGLRRFVRELRHRRRPVEAVIRGSLIDRAFAHRIHLEERLEQLRSHNRPDPADDHRRAHARAVAHPYVAAALERYDRVAARCGIEVRHPFFDLRLVKLCLALPWDLKVRGGRTKVVLRSAFGDQVSNEVRRRNDDANVMWPMVSRIIAEERNNLHSTVDGGIGTLGPYVDRAVLARDRGVATGNLTLDEEVRTWEAATLARWLAGPP